MLFILPALCHLGHGMNEEGGGTGGINIGELLGSAKQIKGLLDGQNQANANPAPAVNNNNPAFLQFIADVTFASKEDVMNAQIRENVLAVIAATF